MRRVIRVLAAVVASQLVAGTAAAAAGIQCGPRPDDPLGYQVIAVKADQVEPPATTPPIAILDSGVAAVPELQGRLRPGFDATTGKPSAADDRDGHGTAVATFAAGSAGAVRGVSPTSPVVPIRIFDARGNGTASWVAAGIRAAVARGAGVINISAAGEVLGADRAADRLVENAIDEAVTRKVLVVAPSGNEGAGHVDVPAAYPHVLAVGATDESNLRAPFSNLGSGLDLVAPGADMYTAAPRSVCASGYAFVSGTSFAAPAVAGAAALLEQLHPGLDASQLTDMLRLRGASAPSWSAGFGFGMLDVPAVLSAAVAPPDAPEVDDTVSWAKRHSPVLGYPRKSATVQAHVAPHTDPADTFRVRLRKRDRLRVVVHAPGATLALHLSDGKRRLAFGAPVARATTYYVTVDLKKSPPAGTSYTLELTRGR
jgi:Subtilase family